jgi:hypothetical protein
MRDGANRGDASAAIKPRIAKLGYVRFLTLKDLDGRCRAAARVKEIMAALESDLGGDLTEGQRQLVTRAAMSAVMCEDFECRFALGEPIELPDYLTAINVQRRVLATLGLARQPRELNVGAFTPLRDRLAQDADVVEVTP